jgi:hypothetical protein
MVVKILSEEELVTSKQEFSKTMNAFAEDYKDSINGIVWDSEVNYYNDAKLKTKDVVHSDGDLFMVASTKDVVVGKPQINGTTMNRIVVLRRVEKINRDKYGKEEYIYQLKFMDDSYDRRYDGKEIATLALDFYTYIVVGQDNKTYTLLTKQKLPNEVCTFRGMAMPMSDAVEVSKTLKINKLTDIFFVYSFESAVKTLPKEELVKFTKESNITLQDWRDLIGFHPLGTINRYPEETENLRSIIMLSGKKDNYPLSVLLMGKAGSKKSAFLETLDHKINEETIICEGSITTLKGLTPSFVSKPANPGFLCSANRLALVDELGKMVEKELNRHEQQTGNLLGDFNSLLEHKKRTVSSGNDNSTEIQMTAKTVFTSNPVGKRPNIHQHIGTMDSTFMSRNLIWVQDDLETKFVMSDDAIISPEGCLSIYGESKGSIGYTYTLRGKVVGRSSILTIFDSCYSFLSDIDSQTVKEIVLETTALASEPMKSTVWQPRALHHVFLVIDGLCKQRCLFEDYDPSFKANEKDYTLARKLLFRMVRSWDVDFK